jgi:hypothetical protein
MEKTFIYGLVSKSNPETIRYIGKADKPENRIKRHIHNTKYDLKCGKKLTHKDYWIIKENYEIDFIVLEECEKNVWQEREKYYLEKIKNLTNTASGGKGGCGIIYKMTYDETKKWVYNNLKINSKSEWFKNIKNLPPFIPSNPREVYLSRGWVSWGNFLSTGRVWDNNVNYVEYNESKKLIKEFGILTGKQYKENAKENKIPKNIPNRPERYYKNRGWISWGDFLGTGRVANQYKKKVT